MCYLQGGLGLIFFSSTSVSCPLADFDNCSTATNIYLRHHTMFLLTSLFLEEVELPIEVSTLNLTFIEQFFYLITIVMKKLKQIVYPDFVPPM